MQGRRSSIRHSASAKKGTRDEPINLDSDDDLDFTQADLDAILAQELRDKEVPMGTRECLVGSESSPVSELPSLAGCYHPPQTCSVCYAKWIAAQLEGSSWREARCP
jgi:hypothetical protein